MEDYRPPQDAVLGHCPTLRAFISDDHGTESSGLRPDHVPGEEDFEFSCPTAGSDHDYPVFSIRSLLSSREDGRQVAHVEEVAGDFCKWTPRKRTCKARRQRAVEKDSEGEKRTPCRKVLAGFLGGSKGRT